MPSQPVPTGIGNFLEDAWNLLALQAWTAILTNASNQTLIMLGETAVQMFPEKVTLANGIEMELRPMEATDAPALHEFFTGLSDDTRRHLRDDVTDAKVVQQWAEELDYDRVLPILAFHEGSVVGAGTLHTRPRNWQRHMCEVRLTVAEDYRGQGLGTALLRGLLRIAVGRGLQKCVAQVMEKDTAALVVFRRLGFQIEGVLKDFAIDADGEYQNVIVLCNNPGDLWRQFEDMVFEMDQPQG
jgi:L-amino acid N-acyltransferase YncA